MPPDRKTPAPRRGGATRRISAAAVATAVLRGRTQSRIRSAGQGRDHARTRAKILKVAHRLYGAAGYSAVSMREVAKRVGFSAQAIYYYFPSKEAMFAALADEGLRLLEMQHPSEELPDAIENLRLLYVRYYDFSKAHPEYFTLLWMDPAAAVSQQQPQLAMIARMTADTARRIERCVNEGIFPANLDVTRASGLLFSAVHGPAVMGLTGRPASHELDETMSNLLDAAILAIRTGIISQSGHVSIRQGPRPVAARISS